MADGVIFDSSGALDRVCGDYELLNELFGMLQEQAGTIVPEIQDLLKLSDLPNTSKRAHCLKGALGNLGANNAKNVAQELEIAAKNGDSTKAETLIKVLEGEIETFYGAFKTFQNEKR
jgi:HPt (histidine-containing phosphotransfer) domain-containing protein